MIPLFSPVVVTWLDAHGTDSPMATVAMDEVEGLHKPYKVETYGVLVRQDETGITLMGEYFREEKEFRGRTFVPAGMLVSVEVLRKQAKKQPRQAKTDAEAPRAEAGRSPGEQPEGDLKR